MRRWMFSLLVPAMAVAMTGCIGVAASDNSRVVKGAHDQIAVVGDDVYVVNTKTGEAKKVDLATATAFATPVKPAVTASTDPTPEE